METKHLEWLEANDAYEEITEWALDKKIEDLSHFWNVCDKGDWLLWIAENLKVEQQKLTLTAALCSHTVIQLMHDLASREAVRIAFLYGRGKATIEQLRNASDDASVFASVADQDAWEDLERTGIVDWQHADACSCAWACADVIEGSVVDAAELAERLSQKSTADLVRKILTNDVLEKIKTV